MAEGSEPRAALVTGASYGIGGATAIGPILLGMRRPVHVLERGADVQDIVNMAAVAVVDAQERSHHSEPLFAIPSTPTPALSRT